jgi:Fe2+ transport system protein B
MSESEPKVRPPDNPSSPTLAEEIQEGVKKQKAAPHPSDEALAVAGEEILDREQKIVETKSKKQKLQVEEDRHKLRIPYIDKLFGLTVVWLAIVVIFLFLQATTKGWFHLSDSVLIAFITSTTVAVIGLFMLVGKWLFPSSEHEESKTQ